MSAAEQLAAMDLRGTDVRKIWDTEIRFPDPGQACMDIYKTAQLYWPALGPGKATERTRGCDTCGAFLLGFPADGILFGNPIARAWCGRCAIPALRERVPG